MSLFSKTYHRIRLLTAALLLPLLCACSYMSEETEEPTTPQSPTADYININIVVSSGNEGTTRAPLGGENGDGREAGSERENQVNGITLMLYQTDDDKGINTTENPTIDYIQYFPTMILDGRNPAGTNYPQNADAETEKSGAIEVKYTTGDQPLGKDIKKDEKYHVIVVANLDLRDRVTQGITTLNDIRELTSEYIYNSGTGIGVNATNFIMASEKDHTIDFSDLTQETSGNKRIYKIENAIRIERLAARVDFWMNNASYDPGKEGYVYDVEGNSGDKFVLTAVTPFNLSDDEEYFIKRVTGDPSKDWSEGEDITYLGNERVTTSETPYNYVLDPYTIHKTGNTLDYMMEGYALDEFLSTENSTYEIKKILLKNCRKEEQLSTYKEDEKTGDNIIICYPKENTLWKSSPLYYYATGLCIEGNYYKGGEGEPTTLTYYGFIRHQGESTTSGVYSIVSSDQLDSYKKENNDIFPMNFGVVRNNIYRISIDKIKERGKEPPEITWKIKVKNWDKFKHDIIYM